MLCIVALSAQTTAQEPQWGKLVKIKLKSSVTPVQYWAGDVDSIYFELQDTAKYEPIEIPTVDLGLPSGLLWEKNDFAVTTPNGDIQTTFPWIGIDIVAKQELYGEGWRMATEEDFQELIDNCEWTATTQDDVEGFLVTSKSNGNSIFLPFNNEDGDESDYWAFGTECKTFFAYHGKRKDEFGIDAPEASGLSLHIRAVCPKSGDEPGPGPEDLEQHGRFKTPTAIDMGLGVKWANFNLGAENVTDYGGYFGWGDAKDSLTIYSGNSEYAKNKFNFAIGGDTIYDIAAKDLGGHWRMPKPKEIDALAQLHHEFVRNYNGSGINAWVFTSSSGQELVFPCAGYYSSEHPTSPFELTQFAYIWSDSTGYTTDAAYSYRIVNGVFSKTQSKRAVHMSIRPVYDENYSGGGGGNDNPEPVETDPSKKYYKESEGDTRTGIIPMGAVDMGTSVKWARWNLGAMTMTGDFGQYYAWGDTISREPFTDANYTSYYKGVVGGTNNFYYLEPEYDAATYLWGSDWSTPQSGDFVDLLNACANNITWTSVDGVPGYMFKSNTTGNEIFFPAGGHINDTNGRNYIYKNVGGYYWSNTVFIVGGADQAKNWATSFNFWQDDIPDTTQGLERWKGLQIRPVMRR